MSFEPSSENLSRRERQIMDVVYRKGNATAPEVMAELDEAPSYSAVRTFLGILVEKGHLVRKKAGLRYVYTPTMARSAAAKSELTRVLRTFFNGSVESAVMSLLQESETELSDTELERLAAMIQEAREGGR